MGCGRFGIVLALATLLGGCPSLEDIPLDVCGNGVVETDIGEDCDAPPEAPEKNAGDGSRCARANEANACHFTWDAATCCPDDTGAGLDGRCRRPSGVFEEDPILHVDELAIGLGNADVDGDGYKDLALRYLNREIELRFLGPSADPEPVRDVRPAEELSRATFGHLADEVDPAPDGCGRPTAFDAGAVFIPGNDGVRVLLGSEEGLLPQAFPTFTTPGRSIPIALPVNVCLGGYDFDGLPPQLDCPGSLGDGPAGAVLLGIDFTAAVADDPRLELRAFPGLELDDLAGPIQRIVLPGWVGCDAIVLAFGSDAPLDLADSAMVVGLCALTSGGNEPTEILEQIPIGDDGRVFVLDADGDGFEDLVVGADGELRIHLGDGAGRFGEDGAGYLEAGDFVDRSPPLAVGYLNDDAAPDAVFSGAILGSTCDDDGECTYAPVSLFAGQGRLHDAVLADVNGDGRADVVGAMRSGDPAVQPALAVITSAQNGLYTLDVRPTEDDPRELRAGDFDGDGIEDVVMVVGVKTQCDAPNVLQVLYGAHGLPGEAVPVARIDGVQALATGLIGNFQETVDGVGDIGLTTTCKTPNGAEEHQATILFGNQSRGVDSPYQLVAVQAGGAESLVFATGKVLPGDRHPALVALGESEPYVNELSIWRIPSTGVAELEPGSTAAEYQPRPTGLPAGGRADARVVGDLDCGIGADAASCVADEIVVFQSSALPSVDEPRLTIFGASSELSTVAATGPCPGVPGSGAFLATLEDVGEQFEGQSFQFDVANIVDVDADGLNDVVAWWFGADPVTQKFVAGGAYVFWNGPGGFGGSCPEPLATPDGLPASGISQIDLGDDVPWLAFTTRTGIYLANVGAERDVGACSSADDPSRCRVVAGHSGVLDMSVLDYDHDGLEDLVIASSLGVDVFRQRPLDEVLVATATAVAEGDD